MTNIEQKAQALVDKVRSEYPLVADFHVTSIALMRTIEQHEAFRQEVSDTIQAMLAKDGAIIRNYLDQFIIPAPKPDPLEEILREIDHAAMWVDECAKEIRDSLDARGFEIRKKG